MQEESGEAVCQDSSVLVWPCPLCQQERPDRDILAQHLTEKHSVLPACLDRLLDTATPVKVVCGDNAENASTQCDSGDTHSSQQMPSETNGALSDLPENTTGAKQDIATACMLRSVVKVHSCPEEEILGEGEKKQGVGRDHPELGQESSQLPESTTAATQKGSLQLIATKDSGNDGTANSTNTSKTHADPALEKFLDPTRPFKCNACLESFTSKSALSVHYSSTSHLHRMRTGSSMQSDEKETSSSATSAPAPYLSRPFFSNKPYQCAVCRVSYNHAFTLESHLKSVLHQTRSRNTVNSAGSAAGSSGKKGSANVGNNTSAAINSSSATQPGRAAVPSPTGNGGSLGSLTLLSGPTKDGEQSALGAQAASSPCPHSAPGLSLLSSPVASAQAVSAFLLTSSSSSSLPPSVQPSLLSAGAGGATGMAVPQLELIAQQQLLLPLFLNGLQAQNQGSNPESASTVLTQAVPLLGLSAAQQALLAQRLSAAQHQVPWLAAGLPETKHTCTAEKEKEENSGGVERVKKESDKEEGEEGEGRDEITQEGDRALGITSEAMEKLVMKGEDAEESGETGLNCTLKSEKKQSSRVALGAQGKEESGKDSPMEGETNCVVQGEGISHSSEKFCDGHGEPDTTDLPVSGETTAFIGTGCISSSPQPHTDPNHTNDSKMATNSSAVMLKPGPTQPCRLNSEPSVHSNDFLPAGANVKGQSHTSAPPILSEFQSQMLWAFLESRSEADAADPPQADCVALGREVGLSGQQVRRWLEEARREPRERPKGASTRMTTKMAEEGGVTQEDEMEEGVLTIVEAEEGESPEASGRHAIDLSRGRGRGKGRELGKESPGEPCLTSDSDNEGDGFYTSVIVTDEESQSGPATEDLGTPAREEVSGEQEEKGRGGKVLRSSTVFLSDAEDTDEEEDEGESGIPRVRKRKRNRELEQEEVDVKKERLDPDVDLELEAQADPPVPISVDQQSLPNVLHSLPLSISLTPFTTQFINPYVLSIPPSAIGLGIAEGDRDRGRASTFPNTAAITHCSAAFPDPHSTPPPASHVSPVWSLSNGGICESALDLSMGKKHSSTSTSPFSTSTGDRTVVQAEPTAEGLGLRPTALGVPGAGGLIVVRVKPEGALAIPTANNSIASNNNTRTSTVYIRAAERVSASLVEREREKQHEREREKARVREKEKEREKEQKPTKARRFRDMRRSRTIIQTEQLDVLYGCYFKDPNPGKHEFQQISEWVHLPKKVVQIWFQNMRARERKGEVRFISDGTLAAMGKPLIKFTWPLTLPVFSSSPSPNSSPLSSSGTTGDSAGASPKAAAPKIRPEAEQGKVKEEGRPKDSGASSSTSFLNTSPGILRMPNLKPKPETQSPGGSVRPVSKAIATATTPEVPVMKTRLPSPSSYSSQKRKRGGGDEKVRMKEEDEFGSRETMGPGVTNRMVPKISSTPTNKPVSPGSHKRNGLNDWTPKSSFKINTLSREQLGLSTPRPSGTTTTSSSAKSSPQEGAYQHHSSTPRRPRTHLTSLQVSIMQSCYETCPHPNALECETIGTELGLPLKVVQIWFQNTRAKEKRWRLQQQKQSPGTTDSLKKVDTSSGSFLLYSALRANRPILPKPVQLTVLEPSTPPASGQPASRETLRGRCDACSVTFESRAAGRTHVFSPHHLATLRSTNFGHPPSLVNSGSATGSGAGSGVATQSSPSAASSSS
ncbi:serine-rich adhesin for platelets-like isoform X2 [Anguilla anguilla]|uniref:serine-rich adhesin for platelets-like isoform X2 n=1 Tax=Anguilla anguilla TaxID=7936 RepID=UPI0015A7FFDF|nr:serine-rich adhesin for platelets-like isoform X2 [Anguilla anguilla]